MMHDIEAVEITDSHSRNKAVTGRVLEIDRSDHQTSHTRVGCCRRFVAESWRIKMFSVLEPNGQLIHVEQSFAPLSFCCIPLVLIRLGFFAWMLSNLVYYGIRKDNYFFAYFTHTSWFLSCCYFFASTVVSVFNKSATKQPTSGSFIPSFFVRLMWSLFALILPAEIVVVALYWAFVYDKDYYGPVSYYDIFQHGVVLALLFIDGFILSRMPIRLKHVIFPMCYGLAYSVWSYIFARYDIGTFALYSFLDWDYFPNKALIVCAILILIALPVLHLILWFLGLVRRRTIALEDCIENSGN